MLNLRESLTLDHIKSDQDLEAAIQRLRTVLGHTGDYTHCYVEFDNRITFWQRPHHPGPFKVTVNLASELRRNSSESREDLITRILRSLPLFAHGEEEWYSEMLQKYGGDIVFWIEDDSLSARKATAQEGHRIIRHLQRGY